VKPYTPDDAAYLEDLGRWFLLGLSVCLVGLALRLAVG
tara:strand:- start:1260 stop:1373 length:114 start_codon:yes stop_codon:yes gene_type:complete